MQRGFTLIEMIIYLGLLSLVMSGVVLSAYGIIGSTGQSDSQAEAGEEAAFVMRKIDWALAGTSVISAPVTSATGGVLTIATGGGTYAFSASAGRIMLAHDANQPVPLTASSVSVSSFSATHLASPEGIAVTFTIDGRQYALTKYLEQ